MTIRGINWARQHDWFRWASMDRETGEWYVIARNDEPDGDDIKHTDFDSMRDWAGY